VNIPVEDLNAWAQKAHRTNGHLLRILTDLQAGRTEAAMQTVWNAQHVNHLLLRALVRAGADQPGRDRSDESAPSTETPLELLSSPAAQRFAAALRETAKACREMEAERGIEDGLTEMYDDYADAAEMEVFGPVGLRGME
jgi:hypothetical protein